MSASIPTDGYGEVNWTDLQDNWRDLDATWLQERSVIRYNGDPSGSPAEGRLFYNSSSKQLRLRNSGNGYINVTNSNNISLVDGTSSSEIRASGAQAGTGISFNNSTGAMSLPGFTSSGAITSTGATGTAPFVVASTTNVANLNASTLQGNAPTYFTNAGNISAGTLAVGRGGTGNTVTPTNGGVTYGDGSKLVTTAAGLSGQTLKSNGAGAPTWDYLGICYRTNEIVTPVIGQTVFEKLTGNFLVYYGATTGWKPPWGLPWGYIASSNLGTNANTKTSTTSADIDTSDLPIEKEFITNRWYRATVILPVTGNANCTLSISVESGNGVAVNVSLPKQYIANLSNNNYSSSCIFTVSSNATLTIRPRYSVSSGGSVNFLVGATFILEDIGGAGTPPSS